MNSHESILSNAFSSKEKERSKLEIVNVEEKNKWTDVEGRYWKLNSKTASSYKFKPVETWISKDYVKYFCDSFLGRVGTELSISMAASASEIKKVSDEFLKVLGRSPTKQELKDYLDWFIVTHVDTLISKYSMFKMSFLSKPWNVQNYAEKHIRFEQRPEEVGINPKLKDASLFTKKSMQAVAESSKHNLVEKYGLVLATIWLMKMEGYEESQAASEVIEIAEQITKGGGASLIVKATARHSPYPIWCKFQSLNRMLVDLTRRTGEFFDVLSPVFHEDANTFSFLNVGEEVKNG